MTSTTTTKTATTSKSDATSQSGAQVTPQQNAEHGFTASPELTDNLQKVLVDLIELAGQGKQAHWNVVGRNFRDTHRILDEIIEAARAFADEVAERMRALHGLPDGRSKTVAKTTTLPEYPAGEVSTSDTIDLVTVRLESVVATMRDVHDQVDEEDPTSSDILHEIIAKLEQYAWMVSAENRAPAKK